MDFIPFKKIGHFRNFQMRVTQKIHGTNAQIMIRPMDNDSFSANTDLICEVDGKNFEVRVGSRTRWINPENDNYGFAAFVYANKEEIVRCLGPGQHFGEWAGPGINSGEGLSQKTFVLFDHWKFPPERKLPPQTIVVPVLYEGPFDLKKVEELATDLKAAGSKLAPGFMRPEGMVISVLGERVKYVFDAEETQWTKRDEKYAKERQAESDQSFELIAHLLQPIRLEKLLSRDEQYVIGFPSTLPQICKDYIKDLVDEGQLVGDEDTIAQFKKVLGKHLFKFVKEHVKISA